MDKVNEFCPFIIEAQGAVRDAALKLIKTILMKKKELSLRAVTKTVKKNEVTRGEVLKKIIFESQRQMARTLIDKTTREEHTFSKKAESRMLINEASLKAAKTLRNEEFELRPSTIANPVVQNTTLWSKTSVTDEYSSNPSVINPDRNMEVEDTPVSRPNKEKTDTRENRLKSCKANPSKINTSNMRDLFKTTADKSEAREENKNFME